MHARLSGGQPVQSDQVASTSLPGGHSGSLRIDNRTNVPILCGSLFL